MAIRWFILSLLLTISVTSTAQVIRGRVVDAVGGAPLFSASVGEKGTANGSLTDFDGDFTLTVSKLPVTLVVSYVGYTTQEVAVSSASARIIIRLQENAELLDAVDIVADRITEKQKQSPLTVESMDL
ncbi:MAG: carboxypeptidase-like regulatory domain-containing protein, partial [Bacteroidota bacterium]